MKGDIIGILLLHLMIFRIQSVLSQTPAAGTGIADWVFSFLNFSIAHPWSEWTTCRNGIQTRTRCDKEGLCYSEEQESCVELPVWSSWSEWSPCVGLELQNRTRCDENGNCLLEHRFCSSEWSSWSMWGACSEGWKSRTRCAEGEGGECQTEKERCESKQNDTGIKSKGRTGENL